MLLVLRVDRELAWKDVTRALGSGEEPDATEVARRRKQFERIKEKLAAAAKIEGWVKGADS